MQDREEREIEDEEGNDENEHQSVARVPDADLQSAIVLVELERAHRLRGRALPDRNQ